MSDQPTGLFPTPHQSLKAVLPRPLVDALVAHFRARALQPNNSSAQLSHTAMLQPGDSPLLVEVASRITPHLADFGVHLLGERLGWSIKEMWVNVLEPGGHQAMHNHANSFISGVVYLTACDPASTTVFMKSPGGTEFLFRNDHAGTTPGPFCADRWVSPPPEPGDVALFPSYLMHAVPHNRGATRITLALNAIPTHVDSWGYRVAFAGA